MEEDARRHAPGVSLYCPLERGKEPSLRKLRELLPRERWYEGEA